MTKWSAQSPDKNPIENIWGYMKHEFGKRVINNVDNLKQNVFEISKQIPKEMIET